MKEKEIRELIDQGWIRARMIHEMAGFPKEHVETMMKQLQTNFTKTKQLKILDEKTHEAKPISEKMWSTFSEVEFLAEDLSSILAIIYEVTPSSMEIIEPEEIKENSLDLNGMLNDLLGKIHQLDMAVKTLSAENILLKRKVGANAVSAP